MIERTYGATGVRVAILGFGAARLPESVKGHGRFDYEKSVPVVRRAIDLGVNYIDSAQAYGAGTSEVVIGKAIKGYDRSRLFLTTKIPVGNQVQSRASSWRKRLDISLRRFDTPYIDFVFMHGLTWQAFVDHASRPGRALSEMRKAQQEGLIRHVCFSSHDLPGNIIRLINTNEFAGVLMQYNCLDTSNREAIQRAHEKQMGVAIMGPLAAGLFVNAGASAHLPGAPSAMRPEIALDFALTNSNVTVALSGMSSVEQVEQNVTAVERFGALNAAESADWKRFYCRQQVAADEYCTYCGKCQPCPQQVNIAENFRYMNWQRVWGLDAPARDAYARLNGKEGWQPWGKIEGKNASACNDCGECEPRCPLHIPIIAQLREARESLGHAEDVRLLKEV